MATQTLTQRQTDARAAAPVPIPALAGGRPTTPVILALDLGQRTGWAVRNRDGAPAVFTSSAPAGSKVAA